MLIKRITLQNFRQIIDGEIDFSFDEDKNITLVMGDNGSGKTTLAQAFLWLLYGDTDFKIKEVINRKIRDKMTLGSKANVDVALYVNYNDKEFTIRRRQEFEKTGKKVEGRNAELSITYKENGDLKYLTQGQKDEMIKRMLPKELSRFFIFDGERIKVMSDEIDAGKSREFREAVQGLVGLISMQNAIKHLKPSSSDSTVIGRYSNLIDDSGDEKIKLYSDNIRKLDENINRLGNRVSELEIQLDAYRKDESDLKLTILSETPKIQLKNEYEKLLREINEFKAKKNDQIAKALLPTLDNCGHAFFATPIIEKVIPDIPCSGVWNEAIPKLQAETILYLLKNKKCLCQNDLIPGTPEYDNVYKLLDFVPPKTIGMMIDEVKMQSKSEIKNGKSFFEIFSQTLKRIREIDEKIDISIQYSTDLFNQLSDTKRGEQAKSELKKVQDDIKRLSDELIDKKATIKSYEKDRNRQEVEKDKLINIDESNRSNIIYRAYAKYLFDLFSNKYSILEEQTRIQLEKRINTIFTDIYEGGLYIEVDDRYNIKVSVEDDDLTGEELEKNTAQSYSIIFAFITAIIAMAKDKAKSDEMAEDWEKAIFVEAQGYPLIMDAPLSNFDKTRIENICNTIPKIAQQVVFFIKDTDGEVAELHMSDKIGKKYLIRKVDNSKIHSKIDKR